MASYHDKKRQLEAIRKVNRKNNLAGDAAKSFRNVASGPAYKAPVEALRLGLKMRKAAREHERTPWMIAFVLAMSCDSLDLIPVAGWIITFFFRPVLFVFLFGKGTWKVRLVIYLFLLLDFFPLINIIPISTACVYYAYHKSKKDFYLGKDFEKEIGESEQAYA